MVQLGGVFRNPFTHQYIRMSYLIYGAYGYTGTLIAEEAVAHGHEPLLAGRDASRLNALASRLGLEARAVGLHDSMQLRDTLSEVSAVVHAAGPFVHTAPPMVEACLETRTHYLDVTGELPVLEAIMERDDEAASRDVLLLPAVGVDVVPTDCLARSLSEEMPDAETLEIALGATGGVSKGTLKTAIEQMGNGGRVRRNGAVRTVPSGWTSRTVDFGNRSRRVISFPGGDVVTAGRSTGIPNITVYLDAPLLLQRVIRLSRYVQGLLRWKPLQRLLQRAVERWVPNPSGAARRQGQTRVWASVRNAEDERRTAELRGPHPYTLTARTAVEATAEVVAGPPAVGAHTPSTALGADFVETIDGVERL